MWRRRRRTKALSAVLILYRVVLRQKVGALDLVPRARTPAQAPVVLTPSEVRQVLCELTGVPQLVATLLYGAGLRLQECLSLRIKDLDFERGEITVRRGKGQKDRRVMLRDAVRLSLARHLLDVRRQLQADLAVGLGRVVLPHALARKYPNAGVEWSWQFVFPAGRVCRDPRFGPAARFHLHETAVQRAVTAVARVAAHRHSVRPPNPGCDRLQNLYAARLEEVRCRSRKVGSDGRSSSWQSQRW